MNKISLVLSTVFLISVFDPAASFSGDKEYGPLTTQLRETKKLSESKAIIDKYFASLMGDHSQISVPTEYQEAVGTVMKRTSIELELLKGLKRFKQDEAQADAILRSMEITPILLFSTRTIRKVADAYTEFLLDKSLPVETRVKIAQKVYDMRQPSSHLGLQALEKLKDETGEDEKRIYAEVLKGVAHRAGNKFRRRRNEFDPLFADYFRRAWGFLDKDLKARLMGEISQNLRKGTETDRHGAFRLLESILKIELSSENMQELQTFLDCHKDLPGRAESGLLSLTGTLAGRASPIEFTEEEISTVEALTGSLIGSFKSGEKPAVVSIQSGCEAIAAANEGSQVAQNRADVSDNTAAEPRAKVSGSGGVNKGGPIPEEAGTSQELK